MRSPVDCSGRIFFGYCARVTMAEYTPFSAVLAVFASMNLKTLIHANRNRCIFVLSPLVA